MSDCNLAAMQESHHCCVKIKSISKQCRKQIDKQLIIQGATNLPNKAKTTLQMNQQVDSQTQGDMHPNSNAREATTNNKTNQQFGRDHECKFKSPPTTKWNTMSHCSHGCQMEWMQKQGADYLSPSKMLGAK